MAEPSQNLGRLVAIHGIAPAYLQRAVFVVVLSFMFFLAMMFAYYVRQSLVYFLLSSAFLIIYILTMISWILQRRSVIEVFENGFRHKNRSISWPEISGVDENGTVGIDGGKPITIPKSITDFEGFIKLIRSRSREARIDPR